MAHKKAIGTNEMVDHLEMEPGYLDSTEQRTASERRVVQLRLLWGHRRLLARATGLGLLAFTLIAFLIPNRYVSTTRLMPPDQNASRGIGLIAALAGRETSGAMGLGDVATDVLGLKGSGALFVGILKSRTVQDDLISKFNLRKVYHVRRWEDARAELQDNTGIDEDRKSGIIAVSVTDKSGQRAAAMADEYVKELDFVVTRLNTSSAHREREFLEGRLVEVKQDLETAEKDFSQFASKNTAIDIPAQGKAMIESAAALEGQLVATQTELEGLRQIYTDSNVRVRAAQARVDELRRQLEKLGGKSDTDDAVNERTDQLMYPTIRKLPLLGVDYADLFRRTRIQEAVFETLTREYELAKVEEVKETPSVKVLDPANIPEEKKYPRRLWIILGGTLFSLLGGAAWVFAGTKWNQIDPADPGKILAQEVVESIKLHVSPPSTNGSPKNLAKWRFWQGTQETEDPDSTSAAKKRLSE